eukprot:scaffold1166_cov261-Pinguiococcus_pyrenoidosus.AAC.14
MHGRHKVRTSPPGLKPDRGGSPVGLLDDEYLFPGGRIERVRIAEATDVCHVGKEGNWNVVLDESAVPIAQRLQLAQLELQHAVCTGVHPKPYKSPSPSIFQL